RGSRGISYFCYELSHKFFLGSHKCRDDLREYIVLIIIPIPTTVSIPLAVPSVVVMAADRRRVACLIERAIPRKCLTGLIWGEVAAVACEHEAAQCTARVGRIRLCAIAVHELARRARRQVAAAARKPLDRLVQRPEEIAVERPLLERPLRALVGVGG